jgi:3-methyl-2-oxobutanoate hydroxymethyltransferase
VKQYAQIRAAILDAIAEYKKDVLSGSFPGPENSFTMPADALEELKKMMASDS